MSSDGKFARSGAFIVSQGRPRELLGAAAVLLLALVSGYSAAGCPAIPTMSISYNSFTSQPDYFTGLAVDASGNIIGTGYSERWDISQSYNWVTRKYDSAGSIIWSAEYDSPYHSADAANGVAVDSSGNVVVAGYEYRADLGQYYNWAIRKYDKDGGLLWHQTYSSAGNYSDQAKGVAVDASGNIIVVGFEDQSAVAQSYNWMIRKYDPSGGLLWARTYDAPYHGYDYAYGVATDSSGNVVVVGSESRYDISQGVNFLVRKYDTNGSLLWSQSYDSPGHSSEEARAVAIDSSGNIVVAGSEYRGDLSQGYNWVTRKYDAAGSLLWARTYTSPTASGSDFAYAVAIDSAGNIAVAGDAYRSDIAEYDNYFAIKYDPSGSQLSTASYNDPMNSYDYAYGVAFTSGGEVLIGGYEYRNDLLQSYNWRILKMSYPTACVSSALSASPNLAVPVGGWIEVVMRVINSGSDLVTGIFPEISVSKGATRLELISGPLPSVPVDLAGGTDAYFTWTFSVSGRGPVEFTATAYGTDSVTLNPLMTISSTTAQNALILIYGPAVSDRYKQVPGTTFVVWDAATWLSATKAQFAAFDAIVIGGSGAGDPSIWNTAVANRDTWSSAITGNMVMIGSDPEEHAPSNPYPKQYIQQAILFAADDDKPGPGLYVELHDYMPFPRASLTLMGYFGTFEVERATCGDKAHKIAQHAVLDSLVDSNLGNWGCTPHAGFYSWPSGWVPLAIDSSASAPKYFTACDGTQGFVFLLATGVTKICGEPELIKTSSQPGNVESGDPITYTVGWVNNGIGTMVNITFTDTLSANLSYRSGGVEFWAETDHTGTPVMTSLAWAATPAGPWTAGEPPDKTRGPLALRWVVSRAAPDRSGYIRYKTEVTVDDVTYESKIKNYATATVLSDSVIYVSNETVNPLRMGIKLTKTPSGWAIPDGGELVYTIKYRNIGPVTAYNTKVWDTLPPGTLYIKCEGGDSCLLNGNIVFWTLPPVIAVGAEGELKLTVTLSGGLPTIGPNEATAGFQDEFGTPLPETVSNPVTVDVINPLLVLDKQPDYDRVPDGGFLTYTITVDNIGRDTANSTVLWDTLPDGAIFYGYGGATSCSVNAGVVVLGVPDIPPGGSQTVSITVSASGEGGQCAIGPNIAAAVTLNSATMPRPVVASNPVDVEMYPGVPVPEKTVPSGDWSAAGGEIQYSVAWTNTGEGVIRGVTVVDTLPNGTVYDSPSAEFWGQADYLGPPALLATEWATALDGPWTPGEPADGTPGPLLMRWKVDRTFPGLSAHVRFRVRVSATLADGDTITNDASVTMFCDDQVRMTSVTLTQVRQVVLELTKTPSGWTVPAGRTLTYTIGYSNAGSDTATSLSIWDTVPAGATYDSCAGGVSCGLSGGIVSWVLPDLPPHSSGEVSFTVSVTGAIDSLGPNTAMGGASTSAGAERDKVPSDEVTVEVTPGAPVMAKEAFPPDWVVAGGGIDFAVTWTNTEAGDIHGLTILDTLPNGTSYKSPSLISWGEPDYFAAPAVAASWAADADGPWTPGEPPDGTGPPLILKWAVDRAGFGRSGYVRYSVYVSSTIEEGSEILNGAQAGFMFDDEVRWTNTTYATVRQASLTGEKRASLAVIPVGQVLTYQIGFTNYGTDTAINVALWDTLPAGAAYLGCTGGASCGYDGTKVSWDMGTLKPGAYVSVECTVQVLTENPTLGPNEASAYYRNSSGKDRPPEETSPVTVAVQHGVPVVTKVVDRAGACPGDSVYYRIAWGNTGETTLYGMVLVDTFPAEGSFRAPVQTTFAEADSGGTPAVSMEYSGALGGPWTAGEPPDGTLAPLFLRWAIDRVVPGKTGYVEFRTDLVGGLPLGTKVRNSVSATVAYDSSVHAVPDTVTTVLDPGVLAAHLSAPRYVSRTQPFEVTLTVTNAGGADVRLVRPDLSVGPGAALLELKSGPTPPGPVTLSSGAVQTFTWSWSAAGTGMVVFSATATGVTCQANDLAVSGEATTTVLVPATLEASAWAWKTQVDVGKTFLVTMTVTNVGEAPCEAPAAMPWTVHGPGAVTLASGPLPALPATIPGGGSLTFSYTFTGALAGYVSLSTTVSGADRYSGYPAVIGPVATSTVLVVDPPALQIGMWLSTTTVSVGQTVLITMTVTQSGGRDGPGFSATMWQSAGPGGASWTGPSDGTLPVLSPGGVITYTWTATALSPGFVTWSGSATIDSGVISSPVVQAPRLLIQTPANLTLTVLENPVGLCMGRVFKVVATVANTGQASCSSLYLSDLVQAGTGSVLISAVPSQSEPGWLNGGQSRAYTWTGMALTTGNMTFTTEAGGLDDNSQLPVGAGPVTSAGMAIWTAGLLGGAVAGPIYVPEGLPFSFSLGVANTGGLDVAGVKAGAYPTAGAGLVTPQSGPTPAGPVTITPGTSDAFTWTYLAGTAGKVVFTVTAAGSDTGCGDTYTKVTYPVEIVGPRLVLEKTAPASVTADDVLEFTLTLRNAGRDTAFGVVLVDTLPEPLILVSADGATDVRGDVVTWNIGTIGIGQSKSFILSGRVLDKETDQEVTNFAHASYRNGVGTGKPLAKASVTARITPSLALHVYPNPFQRSTAVRGTLKITGLPFGSKVRIYTTRGLLVWQTEAAKRHTVEWDGRNSAGTPVSPGVYLWVVERDKKKDSGRLVVE